MGNVEVELNKIIDQYNEQVKNMDSKAKTSYERAYGGVVRAAKGSLVESIAKSLVQIAWRDVLKQSLCRMEINKKKMPIGINNEYISRITDPKVREYVETHRDSCLYKFCTDVQVFVDGTIVIPVECKAYCENAMLKRILFDAKLMKEAAGTKTYYLIQLESQLGGDYSKLNDVTYGSPATHALLSHEDVDLKIITLLEGERKVKQPIHDPKYFKELKMSELKKAVNLFVADLEKYAR